MMNFTLNQQTLRASYALPVKDEMIETLPISEISKYVDIFKDYAREHKELTFVIVRIGCGLAGYTDKEMAPLFKGSPKNCHFPIEWYDFLRGGTNFHQLH